jgi:dihydrofolate reductase
MGKVRASAFSVSLDGFAAGHSQDIEHPFGVNGGEIPGWMRKTQVFHDMIGQPGGSAGVDNDVARSSMENIGAWIMGRNMFGPVRGPWQDYSWTGWWGPNPPYHVPVFVLTHHARPPIEMEGGTVFHFVTDGPEAALARAKQVAGAKDIRVGGGASVIRQFLQARLLDQIQLAVSPILVGRGENLFAGLDLPSLGYACVESATGENATHVRVIRQ